LSEEVDGAHLDRRSLVSWIRENSFQIVVLVLFVWVHLKMHGKHGHGMHGGATTGHQTDAEDAAVPISTRIERRPSHD
jgi:hypothetical protein